MAYKQSGSLHDPELLKAALVGFEHERAVIVEKIAEIQRQLGGRGAASANAKLVLINPSIPSAPRQQVLPLREARHRLLE